MFTITLLTLATLGISLLAVALAMATAGRRVVRGTWQRRRDALAMRLRPALLAATLGGDPDELAVLHDVGDRVLVRAVGEVLPRVRGEARGVLAAVLEERGVVDRMLRQARHRGAVRRARAAEALGMMGVPRCLPTLARLLEDPSPEVTQVAVRAMGRMGDPAAVPFLLAAIELRSDHVTPGQVAAALRTLGGDVATRLAAALAHPLPDVRLVAVEVLGLVGTVAEVDALAGALDDPEPAVRVGAAHALGRIGGPRPVRPLLAVLDRADDRMRVAALAALGAIGDATAIDAVLPLVGSPSLAVARAASYALTAIGPQGARAIEEPATRVPVAAEALVTAILQLAPRVPAGVSSLSLPSEVA